MAIGIADDNDINEEQVAKAYRQAAQAARAACPEAGIYFDEADRMAAELWGPLE